MKQLSILLALITAMVPRIGHTTEGNLTATSHFSDFLKTDPRTGEPLLLRNGKWVSAEARLNELTKLAGDISKKIVRVHDSGSYTQAQKDAASLEAVTKVQKAGIPAGVFSGEYFAKDMADGNARKVMRMEQLLGGGLKLEFKGLEMSHWTTFADGMIEANAKAKGSVSAIAKQSKIIAGLKKAGTIVKRGVAPAAVIGIGGSVYYISTRTYFATRTSPPAETVQSTSQQPSYSDDAFGAAN